MWAGKKSGAFQTRPCSNLPEGRTPADLGFTVGTMPAVFAVTVVGPGEGRMGSQLAQKFLSWAGGMSSSGASERVEGLPFKRMLLPRAQADFKRMLLPRAQAEIHRHAL